MHAERKWSQLFFIIALILIAELGCNQDKSVDSNGNGEIEVRWQQTALDSLLISDLAASPGVGVFAATDVFGVSLTADNGRSWKPLGLQGIRNVAISPDGYIFAATPAVIGSSVLWRSTDNGMTWESLKIGFPIAADIIAFNADGEVYIGSLNSDETKGGIYRSLDNGDTWARLSLPDSIEVSAIVFPGPQTILAGVSGFGFFRSNDNGVTWERLSTGITDGGRRTYITDMVIHLGTGTIFAGAWHQGIYRSADNGDSWQLTDAPVVNFISIVISPSGNIFAGSGELFRDHREGVVVSTDTGDTWTAANSGLSNLNINALVVDDKGYLYAGTLGDGVFRTVDTVF